MKTAPTRLALYFSIGLSLLATLSLAIFDYSGHLLPIWLEFLLIFFGLFVFEFLVLYFVLKRFIYDRIRLIYKTIHRHKLGKEIKKDHLQSLSGDIIGKVNLDVEAWVNEHKSEMEELRKTENYRREYLGNVSHELKTPLFNIQGFVMTLLDGGLQDSQVNMDFLLKSQKNIERMITLVNDLEAIARLETGEVTPHFTSFPVALLAKEVMDLLEPKASQRQIRLVMGNEYPESMQVLADKENIRTVLTNLIVNSINYGTQGGRTKVSIYDMDENYLIEVSDNGAGIEAIHIPRLFERFYRIDKHRSRSQGGSGLGLAIVKHILEAHHQTINVRSTVGVGSTFSFTLEKAR